MGSGGHEPGERDLAGLVEAALAGDRLAVDQLLATLKPRIAGYCRSRIGRAGGSYADADDVAQEALLAVFSSLESYRHSQSIFEPFVFRIAKNKVADYYRKHSHEQHAQLDDAPEIADKQPGPEGNALNGQVGAQVTALLNTLPARQREILFLRVGAGYSAEETATAMSTTAGAVRVAQHRALATLRERIGGDIGCQFGYG